MSVGYAPTLEDVRKYLVDLGKTRFDLACEILGICRRSLTKGKDSTGKDGSPGYIVREVEKVDPNSPIVPLLRQDETKWSGVITIADEIERMYK